MLGGEPLSSRMEPLIPSLVDYDPMRPFTHADGAKIRALAPHDGRASTDQCGDLHKLIDLVR
jgi:hypothetical protein